MLTNHEVKELADHEIEESKRFQPWLQEPDGAEFYAFGLRCKIVRHLKNE